MKGAAGTVLLRFGGDGDGDTLQGQLSAVVQVGDNLWLASDECNSVERLSRTGKEEYGDHRMFPLTGCLDLPADVEEEIDIEGLDHDDGFLWMVGSHSLKRLKPKPGKKAAKGIDRLAELRADGNRYLVARVPVDRDADGEWILSHGDGERCSARLMGSDRGNLLTEVLRMDEHLAPFLSIPGKDNGLDIEGIAVRKGRVFLGLRGPVLRGWAVIIEIRPELAGPGLLRLGDIPGSDRPYLKHFLDLRGLGVRDLCFLRGDLLVLAGPTMDLDGPAAVYRWRDPLDADRESLVERDDLDEVMEIPYGTGEHDAWDHPEGLAAYSADGGKPDQLLVVYDSPDARRRQGEGEVRADLFDLPR